MKIPIVHTLRDYYLSCPRSTRYKNNTICKKPCFDCSLYSIPKKKLSNDVGTVVGISKFILNEHLKEGYFSKAKHRKTIGNAYTLPTSTFANQFSSEEYKIGYIGRIEQAKGIEVLLKAFSELENPNLKLLVAGSGNEQYLQYLQKKYNDTRVQYLGHIEPEVFYVDIDLLVVPSLWNEPFGRVVIEALSYGLIVVASNRGGISEIIEKSNNGFIFDPSDMDALKTILSDMCPTVNTSRTREIVADDAIQEFCENEILRKYLTAYREASL
jgi:glycosyltransferase involved in cell wall biosynthesis